MGHVVGRINLREINGSNENEKQMTHDDFHPILADPNERYVVSYVDTGMPRDDCNFARRPLIFYDLVVGTLVEPWIRAPDKSRMSIANLVDDEIFIKEVFKMMF